jgi:alpha-beta hydrolase superfamily lysophospholipase
MMPGDYLRDGSKRGVIFGHSRSGDATHLVTSSQQLFRHLEEQLRLPMLGADFGGPENWGNPVAITRVGQAFTYLQSSAVGASTEPVILMAQSMGAVTVLNWARANLASVAAAVLFLPVVDLSDVVGDGGYLATSINSAYSGGWLEATYGAVHNPATYAASLSGLPIQIWHTSDDPIVSPATVTAFAQSVGSSVEVHSLGAMGHTSEAVDTVNQATVLAFLSSALS